MASFASIDKYNLDEECANQPDLYRDHAQLLADAKFNLDENEAEFELVKAELDRAIRKTPRKYGITRVSERAIDNAVILQPEYQQAARLVREAKHAVETLKGAVITLEHRKQSLENLTYLQGQGYFAEPKVPRSAMESVAKVKKRMVRAPMQRRKNDDD